MRHVSLPIIGEKQQPFRIEIQPSLKSERKQRKEKGIRTKAHALIFCYVFSSLPTTSTPLCVPLRFTNQGASTYHGDDVSQAHNLFEDREKGLPLLVRRVRD